MSRAARIGASSGRSGSGRRMNSNHRPADAENNAENRLARLLRVEVDHKGPEPLLVCKLMRDPRGDVEYVARLQRLLDATFDRTAHEVVVLGAFLGTHQLTAANGRGRARLDDPETGHVTVNPGRVPLPTDADVDAVR